MRPLPFRSLLLADVGISFGDEGKGRLIPELITELRELTGLPDPVGVVLKVNGGANSGHTAAGLKLNLLPAGVVDASVAHLALGLGVVADPRKLGWEAAYVRLHGHEVRGRLVIDERTQLSDLSHRLLDLAWEDYRTKVLGGEKRGTTGRGITPAFADEVSQWAIPFADFLGPREVFAAKLRARLERAAATIQHVCRIAPETWHGFFDLLSAAERRANAEVIAAGALDTAEFDFTRFRGSAPFTLDLDALEETYWQAGQAWRGALGDVREVVRQSLRRGRYVIGEFGQSYWLDKRHGFAPNVTASHTFTAELFQSAALPVQPVHTIAVCKAYDTKVGTHTFLCQMPDGHPLGTRLKTLEFGTSTGRQRMVGWCDCVEKGDALRYGGYDELMINKLDALSDHDGEAATLRLCTAYRDAAGRLYRTVPRDEALRRSLVPVYRELPGWREDVSGVRRWAALPRAAQRYLAAMVKHTLAVAYRDELPTNWAGTDALPTLPSPLPRVRYIGVGPAPSQIIRDCPDTPALLAYDAA